MNIFHLRNNKLLLLEPNYRTKSERKKVQKVKLKNQQQYVLLLYGMMVFICKVKACQVFSLISQHLVCTL